MKKKYLSILIILIVIVIYVVTKDNLGNGYRYNDLGFDYWQTIVNEDGEVVPSKVVEFHSDSNHIIAVRIIVDLYECYDKSTKDLTPDNNIALPFISQNTLEYWFIDKKKEIAYISKDRHKIETKIKVSNSTLIFDKSDYKDNTYMKSVKNKLNPQYTCILTNNPVKDSSLKKVIDLDKVKGG